MKLRFLLPEVKGVPEGRPSACSWCGALWVRKHARVSKPLKDLRQSAVTVQRYRCGGCGRSFRHYPEGVDQADQSQGLRALAALLWGLGLSLEAASQVLKVFGVELSKMSVWRDVQAAGEALGRRPALPGRVRILGADETGMRVRGQGVTVGFVVDARTGHTLAVEVLLERDAGSFLLWLQKYVRAFGAEVLVTDDLSTYKPVVERLRVRHQVCLAHVRKNVAQRLKKLPGQEAVKEAVRELLHDLPPWGEQALRKLARTLHRNTPWRMFLRELADKWPSLRLALQDPQVPATNNGTERAIGRSKIRYKTVRGFKSLEGLRHAVALTQWLYTPRELWELGKLVA